MVERRPSADAPPIVSARDALSDLDAALHRLREAYEDWLAAARADVSVRRQLLREAEARLEAAREALDRLETALADARQAGSGE